MNLKENDLNTELYIAKRLFSSKEDKNNISRRISKIAVFSISLSLAIMICSIAIVTGFKEEIRKKIIGFSGHIQIMNYDSNLSYETAPVSKEQPFYPTIDTLPGIQHIQVYASKAGIIKTSKQIQGVVLKGIDSKYDWSFFRHNLVQGNVFDVSDTVRSNAILISKYMANALSLKVGDKLEIYFIQDPPRVRKFEISGIYDTSLEELDKIYALIDIRHIQRLNGWDKDQVSGFEIIINDFNYLDEMTQLVRGIAGFQMDDEGSLLRISNIVYKYPQIFDWLGLFDLNVIIIIFLMLSVAGFNMISGLLILVLDRTNMIGILKTLGANNISIRKVFLYLSGFFTLKGLLWGNMAGILLCLVQQHFHPIKLDPSAYFLNAVPINFSITQILLLNIGTLVCIILVLTIPSYIISRISPSKTIQFS